MALVALALRQTEAARAGRPDEHWVDASGLVLIVSIGHWLAGCILAFKREEGETNLGT